MVANKPSFGIAIVRTLRLTDCKFPGLISMSYLHFPKTLLFAASRQVVSKGLLLALFGILGTIVSDRMFISPAIAQRVEFAQTEENSQTEAVTEQLLGRWEAQDGTSGEELTLIFAPDNTLFMLWTDSEGSPTALKLGYQINPGTEPMQMDITVSPEQDASTIFAFTPEGNLRIELRNLEPGQLRPTALEPDTPVFDRVSDATTLPEGVQAIELETQPDHSDSDIVEQYITILSQAQQAYYIEEGKFAPNLEELGIVAELETERYIYQMVPQGDRAQSVAITARPKDEGLPSYTGAVLATSVNGTVTTVSGICVTDEPSNSPPALFKLRVGSTDIQCPAGSSLLSP